MNIKQRRLPSAYQEVEWIEANKAPYLILNYFVNENTSINTVCAFMDNVGRNIYGWYIDGSTSAETKSYTLGNHSTYKIRYSDGYYFNNTTYTYSVGEKLIITHTNSAVIVNGDTTAYTRIRNYAEFPLYIFGRYNANTEGIQNQIWARIYSMKISENNSLLYDLVPCYRISDSEIGMYDTVNGTFYTNQGTGSFTKGADVVTVDAINIPQGDVAVIRQGGQKIWQRLPWEYQEVEWIGATGTQYIDTGFKPNSNFSLEIEWKYNSHTQGIMEIFTGSVDSHTGTAQRLYLGRVDTGTTYEDILWGANRITHGGWDTLNHSDVLEYNGTNTILTHDGVRTVYDYANPYATLDTSLAVFGYKANNGTFASIPNGQIYKYKITSNGSAYLNLIPCYRISDSVIGMYDTVNGVFYTNQGSGTFTKGC